MVISDPALPMHQIWNTNTDILFVLLISKRYSSITILIWNSNTYKSLDYLAFINPSWSGRNMVAPCQPPRILQHWYQNVAQDVNIYILGVPKKITLAKFEFLTNFEQLCDENMSISGMGVEMLNSLKNLTVQPTRILEEGKGTAMFLPDYKIQNGIMCQYG